MQSKQHQLGVNGYGEHMVHGLPQHLAQGRAARRALPTSTQLVSALAATHVPDGVTLAAHVKVRDVLQTFCNLTCTSCNTNRLEVRKSLNGPQPEWHKCCHALVGFPMYCTSVSSFSPELSCPHPARVIRGESPAKGPAWPQCNICMWRCFCVLYPHLHMEHSPVGWSKDSLAVVTAMCPRVEWF